MDLKVNFEWNFSSKKGSWLRGIESITNLRQANSNYAKQFPKKFPTRSPPPLSFIFAPPVIKNSIPIF